MSTIMSVALGLAVGYFVWQMISGSRNGETKTTGRIHRSTKDRKLAGVCGGIAEYLNADPTIIRLVFVLLVLGWGSGVLANIACAVILPEGEAETDEEE